MQLTRFSRRKKNCLDGSICGEKSLGIYGENEWLPDETIHALEKYVVGIKGPLTTPIGEGFDH